MQLRTIMLCSMILSGCATQNFEYEDKIKNTLTNKNITTEIIESNIYLNNLIQHPYVDELIENALKNNPSIQSSLLSLKISELQIKQSLSDDLPTVDATLSNSKTEGSQSNYDSSLSVGWALDIWGKIDDAQTQSKNALKISEVEYQNLKDVLAANIIKNWINITTYKNYIDIESQRLISLEKSEQFVLQRYKKGLGNLDDLDNIRQNIFTAKSTLESYTNSLNSNERSLAVLLGDMDFTKHTEITEEYLDIFSPLSKLGIQTLSRRPDLQTSYLNIVNQDLSTQIAYKNMLPSLNLSATFSDSSTSSLLDSFFVDPVWTMLGSITMPLFNAGNLKAAAEIENLKTEQMYWNYQETLLNAVKEVEEYKDLEESLEKQQTYLEQALVLSRSTEKLDKEKYLKGLIKISDYLTSQRAVFDLERQVIDIIQKRTINRIDLGLALGLGVK